MLDVGIFNDIQKKTSFILEDVYEAELPASMGAPAPKGQEHFHDLRLKSLFWALCLLGVIIYVFAVLFTFLVTACGVKSACGVQMIH